MKTSAAMATPKIKPSPQEMSVPEHCCVIYRSPFPKK